METGKKVLHGDGEEGAGGHGDGEEGAGGHGDGEEGAGGHADRGEDAGVSRDNAEASDSVGFNKVLTQINNIFLH